MTEKAAHIKFCSLDYFDILTLVNETTDLKVCLWEYAQSCFQPFVLVPRCSNVLKKV